MRRLSVRRRPSLRRRLGEERGAVAVMVALLLVPLVGCAAISVDVAGIYADRQAVRNGADAAALAVASDCARDACGDTVATATALASANGGGAAATLGTPTVKVAGSTVTVTASATKQHWFAPVLGFSSSRVSATSQAQWTGMSSGVAQLPLAISYCEYAQDTIGDPVHGAVHRIIQLFTGNTSCAGPAGSTVPAGFAWLNPDSSSSCQATTSVGGTVTQYTIAGFLSGVPSACWNSDYLQSLVGKTIYLPVYDRVSSSGGVTSYHVYGFAAFHLDDYAFGTFFWALLSYLNLDPGLKGYFTVSSRLSSSATPASTLAPDLGARSVYLTYAKE